MSNPFESEQDRSKREKTFSVEDENKIDSESEFIALKQDKDEDKDKLMHNETNRINYHSVIHNVFSDFQEESNHFHQIDSMNFKKFTATSPILKQNSEKYKSVIQPSEPNVIENLSNDQIEFNSPILKQNTDRYKSDKKCTKNPFSNDTEKENIQSEFLPLVYSFKDWEYTLYNEILDTGFSKSEFTSTFNSLDKNLNKSRKFYKNKILEAHKNTLSGPVFCREYAIMNLERLWRPPIIVRVNSWMPYAEYDSNISGLHRTYYLTTVYFSLKSTYTWQISLPYSDYYNVFCALNDSISESFTSGMKYPFPNDYWKAKLIGVSDETKNWRRSNMDLWFRELVLNPIFMLNDDSRTILYEFLEVPKNKEIVLSKKT